MCVYVCTYFYSLPVYPPFPNCPSMSLFQQLLIPNSDQFSYYVYYYLSSFLKIKRNWKLDFEFDLFGLLLFANSFLFLYCT